MHISRKTVNINHIYSFYLGTFVTKVTATDADDPVYGNSAKLVYSILEGQPYFSIEPHTGRQLNMNPCVIFTQMTVLLTCCIQCRQSGSVNIRLSVLLSSNMSHT